MNLKKSISNRELDIEKKQEQKKKQFYLNIICEKIDKRNLSKIFLDKYKTDNVTLQQAKEISEIKDISNLILEDPIIDLDFNQDFESKSPLMVLYLFERNLSTRMFVPASFRVGDVLDRLLHLHLLKKGFKPKDYTACEKDLCFRNRYW